MEERLDEALSFCDIRHLKERKLLSLSGGERQKVMLACLTAIGPKWLLLDEPFANIDNQSAREIAAKLGQLHREARRGDSGGGPPAGQLAGGGGHRPDHGGRHAAAGPAGPRHLDRDRLEQLGVIVPGGGYDPQLPPAQPGAVALELKHLSLGYGHPGAEGRQRRLSPRLHLCSGRSRAAAVRAVYLAPCPASAATRGRPCWRAGPEEAPKSRHRQNRFCDPESPGPVCQRHRVQGNSLQPAQ